MVLQIVEPPSRPQDARRAAAKFLEPPCLWIWSSLHPYNEIWSAMEERKWRTVISGSISALLSYSPDSNTERVKCGWNCEVNFSTANAKVPRNLIEAVAFSFFLHSLFYAWIFSINVKDQPTWIPAPSYSSAEAACPASRRREMSRSITYFSLSRSEEWND